ncbi:hypothetical protein A2818_00150 [Candidatus Nomurabacteria bacterium RIFCSPHIGHO2_01_FULL_40_12]|uniref:Uncharacterized protein n=1 Tax=Candidatus Nomurabacteria bacterium RIFCSPHIGHO2_01_FULL_40_12 TaxID=1801737 RepID=A0A1F6V176_9BACT|nr:MAG: hypothetical protein A2818_00150 [Candidatus Nomurabacteria bacterium RIFCSPHIGHO2_01_FULL_40_12]
MANIIDPLQIKIEQAKAKMSEDAVNAISAVDWKAAILTLREKKGYTFEQLGDMELATELLLCGLITPKNYPKELEKQMKIPGREVSELVNLMNDMVFKKIREELIKNAERKKVFSKKTDMPINVKKSDEFIAKKVPTPRVVPDKVHPILAQKLTGPLQNPTVNTEHSLNNISKPVRSASSTADAGGTNPPSIPPSYTKGKDPYRLSPEE